MEWLKKYWFLIAFMIPTLGAGVLWVVQSDGRMFKNADERINTVKKVDALPTARQLIKKEFLDSIKRVRDSVNEEKAIKSRKTRDSLWFEMNKVLKHQDSINLLNADQMYQIKEQLKSLNQ